MIDHLVLFGASGDLAARLLLPALAALDVQGHLSDAFTVQGTGTHDWDDDAYRDHVREQLAEFAPDLDGTDLERFLGRIHHRPVDVDDPDQVAALLEPDGGPAAIYLALPGALFPRIVTTLRTVGLPEGSRLVFEKPFGEDLDSAVELNELLGGVPGVDGERAVFRVDHFLGLATVQNLLGLRLSNRLLEPVWNSAHVEHVDIVWEETLGLEGRAGYYDTAGQLRDMVQNHLLQVLCLIAMEPPASLDERDLRDRKADVLRSIRPLTPEDVRRSTRRARYGAGSLPDANGGGTHDVPAYVDEEGVDPSRSTETFAEVLLRLDSWRWSGTTFRLRTGKAMRQERKEVVVRFRPVPPLPFGGTSEPPPPNEVRIALEDPERLTVALTTTEPGTELRLVPLTLSSELPSPELPAYGRVLVDVLEGNSALSIRGDEAELAWRVVQPVLDAWAADEVPMEKYTAGSDGPTPLALPDGRRAEPVTTAEEAPDG